MKFEGYKVLGAITFYSDQTPNSEGKSLEWQANNDAVIGQLPAIVNCLKRVHMEGNKDLRVSTKNISLSE